MDLADDDVDLDVSRVWLDGRKDDEFLQSVLPVVLLEVLATCESLFSEVLRVLDLGSRRPGSRDLASLSSEAESIAINLGLSRGEAHALVDSAMHMELDELRSALVELRRSIATLRDQVGESVPLVYCAVLLGIQRAKKALGIAAVVVVLFTADGIEAASSIPGPVAGATQGTSDLARSIASQAAKLREADDKRRIAAEARGAVAGAPQFETGAPRQTRQEP